MKPETVIYVRGTLDDFSNEKVYIICLGKTWNARKRMKEIMILKTPYGDATRAVLDAIKLSELIKWPFAGNLDYEFGQPWFMFEK